ncbi:MAG TPA: alcohol dehydrogenase catalytic domain-containing protein, partial [Acidimicrobiales bacterium]|nr:alcohol dehydrogenase catalytic domain-containing protein [Acidimicrobiales bacterium]
MEMQAAVLWEVPGELKIETVTMVDPGPNDVIVQIVGSGVCGSETHLLDGDFAHFPTPIVPGHEAAGIVAEIGSDVTSVKPGDHVVLGWQPGCGKCARCWSGDVRRCLNPASGGLLIDGRPRLSIGNETVHHLAHISGFAEYAIVLERTCIKIREDAPLEKVCLVGCGVATGYGAVFYNAKVTPGSSAVVIGCGGVGLNVIQSLDIALATTIIAVDINDFKLETAKGFGATHTINSSKVDPIEAV